MSLCGIQWVAIDDLKLTQIYLSQKKLDSVLTWFGADLANFLPVSVHDFLGNGTLYLTDGHTRTFAAWQKGIRMVPTLYDEDDLVTCEIGQILYKHSIAWCNRFGLRHISTLQDRILGEAQYEKLWRERCSHMHTLEEALLGGSIERNSFLTQKVALEQQDVYIYGVSKDCKMLYCEDACGNLLSVGNACTHL